MIPCEEQDFFSFNIMPHFSPKVYALTGLLGAFGPAVNEVVSVPPGEVATFPQEEVTEISEPSAVFSM